MITHKITMDLASDIGKYVPPIDVMQDDQYSRDIEFTLTADGKALTLTGYTAMIRFHKADGTGGNYDRMPDDSQAYEINGNKIKISLAPQVLTAVGKVEVSVALISGNVKLHTFSVQLNVHKNPGLNPHSTSYVSIAGTVPSDGWDAGVFLGSDARGKIVARRDVLTTDRDQEIDPQTQDEIRQKIGAVGADDLRRLEQKIPGQKTYEFIQSIHIEEDDDLKTVLFNIDNNGSPFELTDFIVNAYGAFADGNQSKLYMDINGKTTIANVPIVNLYTTPRAFNVFFRSVEGGCKRIEISESSAAVGYFNGQFGISKSFLVPPMAGVADTITRIGLYSGGGATNEWVIGSTFELWGVRA